VQIAEYTYRRVKSLFAFEALGGIEVKGKRERVPAYRVLARQAAGMFDWGLEQASTPLVGREQELGLLREALDAVRNGQGRIVCLIGEAGLGKSRLIAEVRREWLAGQPGDGRPHWSEIGASSYGSSQPYATFQHYLRGAAGITPTDGRGSARAKLAEMLREDPRHEFLQGVFEKLLGIQADESGVPEGENFKRELFASILAGTKAEIGGRPSVYVYDDMHWTDQASLALEAHLLQLTRSEPVLILFAFRPDQSAPVWQLREQIAADYGDLSTEIVLSSLSDEACERLIGELATDELPAQLQQEILQKTAGNPFFVEEVVNALGEERVAGQGEAGAGIPESVQTLLLSRIDRLAAQTRHTLQLASIIGRTFYERVLRAISDETIALDEELVTLQEQEMIREAGLVPELSYMFRHDLTRDAAYHSMLQSQRKRLHRRVGLALERLFPERLEDEANRLAYHFDEAGEEEKGLRYHAMAGERAAALFAGPEAKKQYTRGIELARALDSSSEWLIRLYTSLGRVFEVGGQYDEAIGAYKELEALAGERSEPALELAALVPWSIIQSNFTDEYDTESGKNLAKRALALARELEAYRAESRVLWSLMRSTSFGDRADYEQAIEYGRQAVEIARKHNLRRELAHALHDMHSPLTNSGRGEEARSRLAEARGLWRELNDLPMLADNLISSAFNHFISGDIELVLQLAREGHQIGLQIGNPWSQSYSLMPIGFLHLVRGEVGAGMQALQEAIPLAEQANFVYPQVFGRVALAEAYGALGHTSKGIELTRIARKAAEPMVKQSAWWLQTLLQAQAQLHLAQGELEKAKASIKEAFGADALWDIDRPGFDGAGFEPEPFVEVALADGAYEEALQLAERGVAYAETSSRNVRPDWLFLHARALLKLGRAEEGYESLLEARDEAQKILARPVLWQILALLSELERERGKDEAAEERRQEAVEVIEFIAEHTGSAELTAGFLGLPKVQGVVGGWV
jgi:predicted ATPase